MANDALLTKQKQKWVNQFKPTAKLRGLPLNYNAGVEVRYRQQLQAMVSKMTATVKKRLETFFDKPVAKEYYATDDSISSQARVLTNQLTREFEQLFGRHAKPYAKQMAKSSAQASKTNLHASLKEMSGGLSLQTGILTSDLNDVLAATVTENVALIKSIPQQYLKNVQGAVMRSITTGNGYADLVPFLAKQEGMTMRRAHLIANDQTKKAYNNINRERMQAVGVKQFEWLHTGGEQKPRPLHEELSGQTFSFDDLPVIDENTGETGIPGQLVNCGCRMVPVISVDGGQAAGGLSNSDLGDDIGDSGDDQSQDDSEQDDSE